MRYTHLLLIAATVVLLNSCKGSTGGTTVVDTVKVDKSVESSKSVNKPSIGEEGIKDFFETDLSIICYNVEFEGNVIRATVSQSGITNGDNIALLLCEYLNSVGVSGKNVVIRNLNQESIGRSACN